METTMNDDLKFALDYMAYATISSPELALIAPDLAAMLLKVQAALRTRIDPAYLPEVLSLAGPLGVRRRIRTDATDQARALVLLNPMLAVGPALRYLLRGYAPSWPGAQRSQVRAQALSDGRISRIPPGRRPVPQPIYPNASDHKDSDEGRFYSELGSLQTHYIPYHAEHCRNPLYLFHAQAWARREYAAVLLGLGLKFCTYSNLSVDELLRNNPHDGTGYHFLQLATNYLHWHPGDKLLLPVPARDQGKDIPVLRGTIRKMIQAELKQYGIEHDDLADPAASVSPHPPVEDTSLYNL